MIHIDTPGLIRLGRRLARLALKLTDQPMISGGPALESIERCATLPTATDPTGERNAVRVRFKNVQGAWTQTRNIRGFEMRVPDADVRDPLLVVNAWVENASAGDSTDVLVLLNREADDDAKLGYGLGLNPECSLVDEADMPLCSFLPRPVEQDADTAHK